MQDTDLLTAKHCSNCEGQVEKSTPTQAKELIAALPDWRLNEDATRIRRDWTVKNFGEGLAFFSRIGQIAETEGHHPDLHLEDYRHVWVELWTHSVGGLTQNDFVLAAKIDRVPVQLQKPTTVA
jgi:4a-hydroxytetrahydrobiopterin dehydratase